MTVTRQEGHLFSLGRCTYCVLTLGSYKKPLIPFYRVSLYQAEFAHAPARTPSLSVNVYLKLSYLTHMARLFYPIFILG